MNVDALRALEKAVEAGSVGQFRNLDSEFGHDNGIAAKRAYNGSLDAAMALHEAVLPGWVARPQIGGKGAGVEFWHCTIEEWDSGEEVEANNMPDPARAWLLAIVRALIAQATE